MTFAAVYAIIVGIGMIAQWSVSLARSQVPELETEPVRIRFHIVAEFITALTLLAGGSGLLIDSGWGLNVYLVSMGMLLYTVLVSPGILCAETGMANGSAVCGTVHPRRGQHYPRCLDGGRAHRTRTCNPLIKSQLLCQIELAPRFAGTAHHSSIWKGAISRGISKSTHLTLS